MNTNYTIKEVPPWQRFILQCGYSPVSLGKLIKDGILSDIDGIHRKTIDRATEKKQKKNQEGEAEKASNDYLDGLAELCSAMNGIYDQAYHEYRPLVEMACRRTLPEESMCHLMDFLLDFTCEERCLELFRQLCRHYYPIYPQSVTDYIGMHKEMWEEEEDFDDEGSGDT